MSVDRYDQTEGGMEKYHQGDYVLFSDYEEEVDSLKEEIQTLKDAIKSAKEYLDV